MLEDAEAMQKTRAPSPRLRLWLSGFLVFASALVLVSTGYQQTYWWMLHPIPSVWHTASDRTYSGVLSAANQSVVVPLEGFEPYVWGAVRLIDISTNETPITLTLRDWNGTVIVQLPNCTGDSAFGPTWLDLYAPLAHYEFPSTPTLTITRETGDVTFHVRVVVEHAVFADPAPAPLYLFVLGYVFSFAAMCVGFALIEDVVRDIRRGLP